MRLGPAHIAEHELGRGEVGLHAQALRARGVARDGEGHGQRPLQQMRDLEPEGLARRLVKRGADPDRRLTVVRLVENALPGKLGRHALDQNLAARVERLLGDVHVERAALHADIADDVRGDGLVEPRFAAELDVLEFEVLAHRHVEHEVASGGAAESLRLHADGLHIAEGLMVEELEHGCGGAGGLERDLALLRVGTQVGDEEAALAKGDFLT